MNERIQQLAAHAKAYANQCTKDIDGDVSWHWMEYYTEKFAELIVKECMKLNSKELSITAIERLLPLYKEHYGVEE